MLTSSLLQLRSRGIHHTVHTPVAVPSLSVILDRQRSSAANSAQAQRGRKRSESSKWPSGGKREGREGLFFRPPRIGGIFLPRRHSPRRCYRGAAVAASVEEERTPKQNAPGIYGLYGLHVEYQSTETENPFMLRVSIPPCIHSAG